MSSSEAAIRFLRRHGMEPEAVEPARDAAAMAEDMVRGLEGKQSDIPMIPTYLSARGEIPRGQSAAVIDAGGTNYRRALVRFDGAGCRTEELSKWRMPGTEQPVDWEDFIAFTADSLQPLLDRTDKIGFCFSYSARITPERDGQVERIDKEVRVRDCEGKLLGASLLGELQRRGLDEKKIVVLNDTVAVLLGGMVSAERERYGGFVGQVSGTGTNTCCSVPTEAIGKLELPAGESMVINLESGMYRGLVPGDFDLRLDRESNNPGEKAFEKMTAGVYLGELTRLMLRAAGEEGLLSAASARLAEGLERIDSAAADAWACGRELERVAVSEADKAFVRELSAAVFRRSARCMCTNLAAMLLLTGLGRPGMRPACVCAEGSLVQKGAVYRPALEELIRTEIGGKLGREAVLRVGEETTLPGAAAAALLNC